MKRVIIIAAVIFALDQITKMIVVQWWDLKTLGRIDVWPPYVNFYMAWNEGINFGLFANSNDVTRWVLITIALGITVWLLNWSRKITLLWGHIFIALVVGGALGNVIDRVIYGAVADFMNVSCCGLNNPYAFNIADISVFAGAFGLVLISNKLDKKA
jgi:signal peptidase II